MHSSARSSIRSLTRWRARTLAGVVVLLCLSMLPPGGPLASLAPPVAQAATLIVTSTADSGLYSLRDQIAAASNGDTITFDLPANSTITLDSQIGVFVALTIDGAGAPGLTISGNSANRIFEISASVALTNVTLADGRATGIGPNASTLTSHGNTARHTAPSNATTLTKQAQPNAPSPDNGGAVYVSNTSPLTLTNVVVRDSVASGDGGGVYTAGPASISSTQFISNTANDDGGGVYVGGDGTIRGSSFSGNTATSYGGGLEVDGVAMITSSTFSNNTAQDDYGGGAYFDDEATISDSSFTNNSADDGGGGAYIDDDGTITNTIFISNTAEYYGGGLEVDGAATVSGSTFIDNTTQEYGGGAYFDTDATISDSSFTNNSAEYYGGGAYIDDDGTITNTSFISNTAQEYGGGLEVDGVATVSGSTFMDNTARDYYGGGAYFDNDATISNSTFQNNTAANGGGAYLDGTAGITSTQFLSNAAQDEGGALFIANSSGSTIRTSRLFDNTAVNGGGALYLASAAATMENNFVGGSTSVNGFVPVALGAPMPSSPPSSLTAIHNTFASPTPGQGVAINAGKDIAGDTVVLTNTIFDGYAVALQTGPNAATISADGVLFSNVTTPTEQLGGAGTITVTNAVTGTAAFVDATARDYHLTKVSDAIDRGVVSSLTTDIDGQTRPSGSAPDLGADEFYNVPPTITATFGDQTTASGTPIGPLPFTVEDANGDPLTVTATSSNQALVPDANVVISGSGANRTVTVTPLPGQIGTTIITITVSDGIATTTYSFTLTVNNATVNNPPTITTITNQTSTSGKAVGPLPFTIGGGDGSMLTVTATSSNQALVPNANIVLDGSGTNRTVTVTPAAGQTGTTTITITVSDGTTTTTTSFTLTVTASGATGASVYLPLIRR